MEGGGGEGHLRFWPLPPEPLYQVYTILPNFRGLMVQSDARVYSIGQVNGIWGEGDGISAAMGKS